jgi:outer membrane protein assembly factor BamB
MKKKAIAIVLGILCLLLILPILYFRTIRTNNLKKQQSVSFPLQPKWQIDVGRSAYDRPVYQDRLVISTADDLISSKWYAINAETGRSAWVQAVNRGNFRRCLTEKYLVLSGPWSLVVLETYTGEIIWEQSRPPAYTATCNDDTVFSSGVPRDSISAYSLATGQEEWGGTEPRKSFDGLVYNGETDEIITRHGSDLYIIQPQTGRLKNSFEKIVDAPDDDSTDRGPMYLIDQGELFIGGTVQNAQTGQVIHKEEQFKTSFPPIVTASNMYLSARNKGIVAYDRADYSIKWIYQPQASSPLNPLAPIAILDETGYAIFSDATLRAFDLETGQELGYWQPEWNDLWWWPICSFPPVHSEWDLWWRPIRFPPILCVNSARAGLTTSEDTLFVSFGDGKLYAFGE